MPATARIRQLSIGRRTLAAVVALTALAAGSAAGIATPAAAEASTTPPPNYSFLYWDGHTVHLGILEHGTWTPKGHFALASHGLLAAVSRTTLLLYDRFTGAATTGTFVNGVYRKRGAYNLGKQWLLATASCDSYMLWKPGTIWTGLLVNGTLGAHHAQAINGNFNSLDASCNSTELWLNNVAIPTYTHVIGTLHNGVFAFSSSTNQQWISMAHTSNSYLHYQTLSAPGTGEWGTLRQGSAVATGTATDFSPDWTLLAGSADTVMFYRSSDGLFGTSTLVGGVYNFLGTGSLPTAITLLAGGK